MCDFCNNIKDVEYIKEHPSWERETEIAQTGEKTFGLWVECEDYYYSGIAIKIKYCPICGRLLTKQHNYTSFKEEYGFDF